MRYGLIAIVTALAVFAGYYFRVDQKAMTLLSRVQKKQDLDPLGLKPTDGPPSKESGSTATSSGSVAGLSTEKIQGLSDSLKQTGSVLGKSVSTILLESSHSDDKKIQIDSIASQISKQVESIPSTLLNQAKVAYCQQVLIEATKSGTSQ